MGHVKHAVAVNSTKGNKTKESFTYQETEGLESQQLFLALLLIPNMAFMFINMVIFRLIMAHQLVGTIILKGILMGCRSNNRRWCIWEY